MVAPTGFEPVFQSRHVFAITYTDLPDTHPAHIHRDSNTQALRRSKDPIDP